MTNPMIPGARSLREFMNRSKERGGRQNYLRDWKKERDRSALVFLHPAASILSLYRHNLIRLVPREDQTTHVKTVEVWGDKLRCLESEEVLEAQHFRDKNTGKRKKPPQVCPICKMLEDIHGLIADRKLDWRTPLFQFVGTDPSKTRILHAGGITGAFNGRKLSDAQKQELAGNLPDGQPDPRWSPASKWHGPIYQNKAFMQDWRSREEVVFTVIDAEDPRAGIQLSIEPKSLGDRVEDVIIKSVKSAQCPQDPEGTRGDPQLHPFAFRWEYDEHTQEISKKYDAIKMERVPLTPEIAALFQVQPPDLSTLVQPWNLQIVRARLEQQLIDKRFVARLDSYFKRAFELQAAGKLNPTPAPANPGSPPPAPRVPDVNSHSAPLPVAPVHNPYVPPSPVPAYAPPAAAAPEELFGCDKTPGCTGAMKVTDPICPVCKAVYIVEAVAPAPPPKPALRPRSAAAVAPAGPPAGYPAQHPGHPVAAPPLPAGLAADPSMQGPDPLGLTPESQDLGPSDADESAAGNSNAGYPGDPSEDIPF